MIAHVLSSSMFGSYYLDCIILEKYKSSYRIIYWDIIDNKWHEDVVDKKRVKNILNWRVG